jgi:DNA-binding transcriptional MocR family regulator
MSTSTGRARQRCTIKSPRKSAGLSPMVRPAPVSGFRWPRTSPRCWGVNKNTVLRAMHVLRNEGLLEFRRGRGITVAGTPPRSAVLSQVRNLMEFARQHGYQCSEIIQMIKDLPQDT